MGDKKHELIKDLIRRANELPVRDDVQLTALRARVRMVLNNVFEDEEKINRYEDEVNFKINFYPILGGGDNSYRYNVWNEGQAKLLELLKVIEEDYLISVDNKKPVHNAFSDRIFIVHGHDKGMRESVARIISRLGLSPVILHEQANLGKTIIEKFEDEASDVGFAVVLLSPDDEGRERGKEELRPRARQNVVFEHGFFFAKLGRSRVVALYRDEEGFEKPSDVDGVLYVPYDDAGAWKIDLVRELQACGYEVSADDIV